LISLDQIKNFFPPRIKENPAHQKYMVKEYIQLQILDYLSDTAYARKLVFIGGTNLRLIKGIDRFSENLDFDCKQFSREQFDEMTADVVQYLRRLGLHVEIRNREGTRLKAFRGNLHFPGLLYDMNLTGHREQRFLIRLECQDQWVGYPPVMENIRGCGLYFPFPVPPGPVLCSMKISALLSRQKGRDFYDVMFLLGQSGPDYGFLSARSGISDEHELKTALLRMLDTVSLENKAKDFEHLLFDRSNSRRILRFREFVEGMGAA
jgi:predicted nucleotidyltransferase component of viral defense system